MIRVRPGEGQSSGYGGYCRERRAEVYGGSRSGPGLVARNVSHVTDRHALVELSNFDKCCMCQLGLDHMGLTIKRHFPKNIWREIET